MERLKKISTATVVLVSVLVVASCRKENPVRQKSVRLVAGGVFL